MVSWEMISMKTDMEVAIEALEEEEEEENRRRQTRKEETLTRIEKRTREARNIARDPTRDGEKERTEKRRPL
jgi:hypothetical protein|tara:strand:+ start:332 stop:547 length:216 start_codon:yes stop_codon:yes gene_type:complete